MDAAQLHVGSPLSLSQWLADWPLQRKRHEFELVEPKRVSLRVPFAETESRPRELGPARMARRYGGSNLQGQVGHQRAFRPRRASHGSPCRWLGRRDALSCPAVAVRQRATDARSVGSIVGARYIQEFALRLMSPAVAVRQRATDARSVGSIVGARYIQEFALRLMSRGSGQAASHRREVGGVDRSREVYPGIRTSLDVTRSWTHVGTTVGISRREIDHQILRRSVDSKTPNPRRPK